ncbi:hypothetical protein, partial [Cronobacter sakazakii]|uniref:hypothetical protein n=1 Tax=Cronobacter sakazakii TaxID=28141 RepID=UPI000D50F762
MNKQTINGYNYEIIGDVMAVQEEREVVFMYYPTPPTESLPIMKHYIIDDLIKMTDDELHKHSLTDDTGFAPIFPDTCYHLTHYWPAAVDIPVASDIPVHYADAIRYN